MVQKRCLPSSHSSAISMGDRGCVIKEVKESLTFSGHRIDEKGREERKKKEKQVNLCLQIFSSLAPPRKRGDMLHKCGANEISYPQMRFWKRTAQQRIQSETQPQFIILAAQSGEVKSPEVQSSQVSHIFLLFGFSRPTMESTVATYKDSPTDAREDTPEHHASWRTIRDSLVNIKQPESTWQHCLSQKNSPEFLMLQTSAPKTRREFNSQDTLAMTLELRRYHT